ncbi:MAG: asparagine synthetase B, partial [Verrucomicrobia bacterium]|nr:asparagine synthetase B [Verrucomicrobiota bacterium]
LPVGSTLSGGMDSSSVACMARVLRGTDAAPLDTFSAIFDTLPQCDERVYMEAVQAQGGFEPHYLHADRLSPLMELDRVLRHEDEAFFAPNLFMHWALYKLAREQGVRVFLDGLDGDTTVSHGYERLVELAAAGQWLTLARHVRAFSRHRKLSPWRILLRMVLVPLLPLPARKAWRRATGQSNSAWQISNPTLRPDFVRRIGLEERLWTLKGDPLRRPRTNREEHFRRLGWGLCAHALEVADRAAAAFSLEPRYPFFDVRLAEYCLALPSEQKMSDGWTRVVLRRAMQNILPEKVQWRPDKSNLGPNFRRGFLEDDRAQVEEVVLGDGYGIAEYVDMPALRNAYERCRAKASSVDEMMVWRAVSLAVWLARVDLSA